MKASSRRKWKEIQRRAVLPPLPEVSVEDKKRLAWLEQDARRGNQSFKRKGRIRKSAWAYYNMLRRVNGSKPNSWADWSQKWKGD